MKLKYNITSGRSTYIDLAKKIYITPFNNDEYQ